MIEIRPVAEVDKYLKVLIYGDPGTGKTTLAATVTENVDMEKTLVINIEGGMLSIIDTGALATDQVSNITEVEEIMWALSSKAKGFEHFNTVIVDSGSELQTLDLEGIVREAKKKKSDRDLDDIHIEDYGKSTQRLKRIFRHFRDLKMNVIVTALVKRHMPPATSARKTPLKVVPKFTASLSDSVCGYMDCVWYLYLDEETGKRQMLTQPEGVYFAKTRGHNFSRELGKLVEDPNFSDIYNLLQTTEGNE